MSDYVVMKDPVTGNPRGFGFVTFENEDSVQKVLDMKADLQIHDKWIDVKLAGEKGDKGKGKGGGKEGGGKGGFDGKGGKDAWGGAPAWGGKDAWDGGKGCGDGWGKGAPAW